MNVIFAYAVFFFFYTYLESFSTCQCQHRIVGGEPALIEDFPYQLALEYKDGWLVCGASIIHNSWAVSAAHCVYRRSKRLLRLRAGTSYREGGTLHQIEEIIIHPRYDRSIDDYDVSVIKVYEPFSFNNAVQKILLGRNTPCPGTPAVVSGWGDLKYKGAIPNQLQKVTLYVVKYETCKRYYGKSLTPRMFCASYPSGGKDSCQGDSGGPLVVKNRLVGIVSGGAYCGRKGSPGVYTDVPKLRRWIMSSIRKKENMSVFLQESSNK